MIDFIERVWGETLPSYIHEYFNGWEQPFFWGAALPLTTCFQLVVLYLASHKSLCTLFGELYRDDYIRYWAILTATYITLYLYISVNHMYFGLPSYLWVIAWGIKGALLYPIFAVIAEILKTRFGISFNYSVNFVFRFVRKILHKIITGMFKPIIKGYHPIAIHALRTAFREELVQIVSNSLSFTLGLLNFFAGLLDEAEVMEDKSFSNWFFTVSIMKAAYTIIAINDCNWMLLFFSNLPMLSCLTVGKVCIPAHQISLPIQSFTLMIESNKHLTYRKALTVLSLFSAMSIFAFVILTFGGVSLCIAIVPFLWLWKNVKSTVTFMYRNALLYKEEFSAMIPEQTIPKCTLISEKNVVRDSNFPKRRKRETKVEFFKRIKAYNENRAIQRSAALSKSSTSSLISIGAVKESTQQTNNCIVCSIEHPKHCCSPYLDGITCEEGHFTCSKCLEIWANEQNPSRSPDFDQMARSNRKDGKLYCPAHKIGQCHAKGYSYSELASHLSTESLNKCIEVECRTKTKQEIDKVHALYYKLLLERNEQKEDAEHEILVDQLRRLHPNARMCGQCNFGPIDHGGCKNLRTHHEQVVGSAKVNNSCPKCGWFQKDIDMWPRWDGRLNRKPTVVQDNQHVFPDTASTQSLTLDLQELIDNGTVTESQARKLMAEIPPQPPLMLLPVRDLDQFHGDCLKIMAVPAIYFACMNIRSLIASLYPIAQICFNAFKYQLYGFITVFAPVWKHILFVTLLAGGTCLLCEVKRLTKLPSLTFKSNTAFGNPSSPLKFFIKWAYHGIGHVCRSTGDRKKSI